MDDSLDDDRASSASISNRSLSGDDIKITEIRELIRSASNQDFQQDETVESEPGKVRSTDSVVESYKRRIGRETPYQYSNSTIQWVTHEAWEILTQSPPSGPAPGQLPPDTSIAIYYALLPDLSWWILVQSPDLIIAYDKVDKHPSLSRRLGSLICETSPFPSLFYNLEGIRSEILASENQLCKLDLEALEFLCETFELRWAAGRQETFSDGTCGYDTLWRLFNPGDLVIKRDALGSEWLLVLVQLVESRSEESTEVITWGLSTDNLNSTLQRQVHRFLIPCFEGRQKISSLPVYPLSQKGDRKQSFLDELASRGRKWQTLMTAPQSCQMHDGLAVPSKSERQRGSDTEMSEDEEELLGGIRKLKERVIIDDVSRREERVRAQVILGELRRKANPPPHRGPPTPQASRGTYPNPGPPKLPGSIIPPDPNTVQIAGLGSLASVKVPVPAQLPFIIRSGGLFRPDQRQKLIPGTKVELAAGLDTRHDYDWDDLLIDTNLTDEQAQLCPATIGCKSISRQKHYSVSVDNLAPVKWNKEAIELLVLDQHKKDLLRGLVSQHTHRTRTSEIGDLIENKGKGLVILLYGPPGVGKTLTAESIGEWVEKPLIALSIGDLIVDESQLERRLLDEFDRALKWDAILLLDEADVVLEARSFEDVRRNGIVSVFLRQLEYFQGVLFLTTNRISTMDVAFQSRIQVAIGFENLKSKGRSKIWRGLLENRRKTLEADNIERILEKVESLASSNLNGRQIRNALNLAEGYAFNEFGKPGMMNLAHIQNAVKAALDFQKFFEESREKSKSANSVWAPYNGDSDSD